MQTALLLRPPPPPPPQAPVLPWTRLLAGESADEVYQDELQRVKEEEIEDEPPDEELENDDEARMLYMLDVGAIMNAAQYAQATELQAEEPEDGSSMPVDLEQDPVDVQAGAGMEGPF
jgi:hypothetical protein